MPADACDSEGWFAAKNPSAIGFYCHTWIAMSSLGPSMTGRHPGTAPHAVAVVESAEVSGWRFSCHKAPAMSSVQRDELAAELRLRPAIPLPEVVFGNSTLQIDHTASGLEIHFDAKKALHVWVQDHAEAADRWEPSSFDFTYSTSYTGTVTLEGRPLEGTQTSETLPLDKLQQQVAILFYERVLLFEDDIRDLGEIYVEVRVRVMEFGFLLLCRYFCRIDDKQTVKLQDTRYYHEFGDDFIWRDHEIRESSLDKLKQALSARNQDQQAASLDLTGDSVYRILKPTSTTTEKLVISS